MATTAAPPWATALKRLDKPHSLISIAREGRLVRETAAGALRVHISPVDECVLTLVDAARLRGRHIGILYPAPAGDVSVLLAAQVLLQALVRHVPCPTVGLATADVVAAARAWGELRIASGPTHTPLSDAFPCLRAEPSGRSPFRRHTFKGLLVGGRCHHDWPVDFVIVDHLAGFVVANSSVPAIHIFADPLDPALETMFRSGELVWSFAPPELRVDDGTEGNDSLQLAPFSVAEERLRVISRGVRANIEVVRHAEAEACVDRVRDDLRTLADVCGQSPPPLVAKGLRVAWQHFTTLLCLPCKPSSFDRFAGLPPIAARATSTFGPEIAAWARMLKGNIGEFGSVLASDMLELRAMLEDSNLFLPRIAASARSDLETVCVVRSHTAARALMQELAGDPDLERSGALHVRSIRRLNREGSWPRAIVVGLLPRWDWHRVDSGLSPDVMYLVLGNSELRITQSMLVSLDSARARWASGETRGPVFRNLLGIEPPTELERPPVVLTVAVSHEKAQPDPLAQLEPLGISTPLVTGDEGVEEVVAEESEEGTWSAAVQAVDVHTDRGRIVLPAKRSVEVRSEDEILDCCAEDLKPGMCLLVGRREGRLGLLEAMADRLQKTRPDLFAASLLVSDLRSEVRRAFRAASISISEFYERMSLKGFDKTYQAARGYVVDSGPLAPRDRSDLHLLNQVLKLGFSSRRILEVFAGAQRLRNFRRAAGRALAAAARESTLNTDDFRVDSETGLSLADLREVVMEATVVEVRPRAEPVPLGELGRLETRE